MPYTVGNNQMKYIWHHSAINEFNFSLLAFEVFI